MLEIIKDGISDISFSLAEKLNLQGKKLREFMQPGEVFITNAQKWRSETQQSTFDILQNSSPPMFVVRTAQEKLEAYKENYTSLRILDETFDVFGKPLPGYWGAIVGIPKPKPETTA